MAVKDKKLKKAGKERFSKSETNTPEDEPTTSELETTWGAVILFILSCVVYFVTMFPGLSLIHI